eukprot:15471398-Alexandrium_andersonii.AAC.1
MPRANPHGPPPPPPRPQPILTLAMAQLPAPSSTWPGGAIQPSPPSMARTATRIPPGRPLP